MLKMGYNVEVFNYNLCFIVQSFRSQLCHHIGAQYMHTVSEIHNSETTDGRSLICIKGRPLIICLLSWEESLK